MTLLCTRPWCDSETRLHLGERVLIEHSTTLGRVPLGDQLLVVRIVAHGDDQPSIVVESDNCFRCQPTEVLALTPAASHAIETALASARNKLTSGAASTLGSGSRPHATAPPERGRSRCSGPSSLN